MTDSIDVRPVPSPAVPFRFPAGLGWGLVAVAIFVIGDSLELVWISAFFAQDLAIAVNQAAWIITAFGAVTAVASYFVGPLCQIMHPRRVMLVGFVGWCLMDAIFIAVALPSHSFWTVLVIYSLRGIGTPLFCYGFLVWLTERAQRGREATTQGWFWFALSGGSHILATMFAGVMLQRVGPVATLWSGLATAVVGGTIGFIMTREPPDTPTRVPSGSFGAELRGVVTILYRKPSIAAGGLVKVINIGGIMGMYVMYVPYLTKEIGMPLDKAVFMFTVMGITGVPGNLLWGYAADRLGWANTIQWIACPINAVAIALLYLVPRWLGPEMIPIAAIMLFWGLGTAAFSPLSALLTGIAPDEVGNAISVVNFASGLSFVVGPALVGALLGVGGYRGIIVVLVMMYILAGFLMTYVQLPGRARSSRAIPTRAP